MNRQYMKRQTILDSAAVLFSQKGFHQTRMDEIAQHANVAKGTLYYNFSSKSQLFEATVTQGLTSIISGITDQLESDLPFAEHFHMLIELTIELYLKNSNHARIFFNELSSGIDPEVLQKIEKAREKLIDFFSELLEEGQTRGYFKKIETRLAAISFTGMLDSVCQRYLKDPDKFTPEEIVDSAYTILSSGLLVSPV